jgi:hypothetical protein
MLTFSTNKLGVCGWACSPILNWLKPWSHPNTIWLTMSEFQQSNAIVADEIILWSASAHLLPHISSCKRLLLLQPGVDFCGPKGWKARIIDQMLTQLQHKPEDCLKQFSSSLRLSNEEQEMWLRHALAREINLLSTELSLLKQTLDTSYLQKLLKQGTEIDLWYSYDDPICKFSPIENWIIPDLFHNIRCFKTQTHGPGQDEMDQEIRKWWSE